MSNNKFEYLGVSWVLFIPISYDVLPSMHFTF